MAGSSAVTILGFGGGFGLSPWVRRPSWCAGVPGAGLLHHALHVGPLRPGGAPAEPWAASAETEVAHAHSPLPQLRLPGLGGAVLSNGSRRRARTTAPEQLDAWADGRVELAAWDASFRAHDTRVAVERA